MPSLEFIGREGCGKIIEPGDPHELARTIISFLNLSENERAERGLKGRSYVERHHDWFACARKITYLIEIVGACLD